MRARTIAAHRRIVDSATQGCGGRVISTDGEHGAVVAEFRSPSGALTAAFDISRMARAKSLPDGLGQHLRSALDTCTTTSPHGLRSWDLGIAVSRALHLHAVARGGQTILSHSTAGFLGSRLPRGIELLDRGVHRLPDLGPPERVYEVSPRDSAPPPRPLRSLDALPNNLPGELTTFIGRGRELADVRRLLERTRLLTLTGPGGCGKSRLALQAAATSLRRFGDGIWRVELAAVSDVRMVGQAVATALAVRPLPGQSPLDAAVAYLSGRRALVLLDNCEHVIDAACEIVMTLLEGCPEAIVLTTSREPLGLPAETTWRVPSLSLPATPLDRSPDVLAQSDAASLFIERATRARPDFTLSAAGARALAAVCGELDGIPLAIELAAARVRMMSVHQIESGLSDRFGLLTGGARTLLPRHRTLRASVDWSHALLSDDERALFRRLAVFAGGFTLEAVEVVGAPCGDEQQAGVATLAALVDKSLVVAEDGGSQARYRLLETVREYALERLRDAGELDAIRDRHRDFFVAFAERAASALVTAGGRDWLPMLDAEAANFAAALHWAQASKGDHALRLCAALTLWWKLRGMFAEADASYELALAASEQAPSALRARVLWGRAFLLRYAGRYQDASQPAREALELAEQVGDRSVMARALHVLGMLRSTPDPVGSRPLLERSRELAREAGDDWCFAGATIFAGWSCIFTDDFDDADRLFAECQAIVERLGYDEFVAWRSFGIAWRHQIEARFDRFFELAQSALAASRRVGEPVSEGVVRAVMGHTELAQGRPRQALRRIEASRAANPGYALYQTEAARAYIRAGLGDLDAARAGLDAIVSSGLDSGWFLAPVILQLAEVTRLVGDSRAATRHAERGLDVAEQLGSPWHEAWARWILGRLAGDRGEWTTAATLLHDALAMQADHKMYLRITQSLDALAEVTAGSGGYEKATRLLAAAARARADLGIVRWAPDAPAFAALERQLSTALGAEAFAAAWRDGARLTLEEAVAWARRGRGSRKRPAAGWGSLTPTELTVARHAAAGLTNPEIAKTMFIERGTVKAHLSHIYDKLDVRNRTQLTAELARQADDWPAEDSPAAGKHAVSTRARSNGSHSPGTRFMPSG